MNKVENKNHFILKTVNINLSTVGITFHQIKYRFLSGRSNFHIINDITV